MTERRCAHCGGPIEAQGRGTSNRGRPPKFCSRKCLDDHRADVQKAERLAKREGRKCEFCGNPIDQTRNNRARTCSVECNWKLSNKERAASRRVARRKDRAPCARCGNAISDERHAGSRYCSYDCKKKAMDARWRAKSPGYMRQYLYGITEEDYQALLAEQDGKCAICHTDDWPGKDNRPHVDHCHDSSKVRGILCALCNNGLGNFKDDPARLRAAAGYVERARALS